MKKHLVIFMSACCMPIACATDQSSRITEPPSIPEYCRVAQQVVTRTMQPVDVRMHDSFDGFVKSKAIIPDVPGAIPEIQQFQWLDSHGVIVGVSCKLKSADHLNLVYGDGTAGPDGLCQDMNRRVYQLLNGSARNLRYTTVIFDENESVTNAEQPGMTGPDWLKPYEVTYVDDDGRLHVRAKGFRVDFTDPQFARAPARFRGIHYCHFIAPDHLLGVMTGSAEPGVVIGREVDTSGYRAPTE
jgi:hypothetical protein